MQDTISTSAPQNEADWEAAVERLMHDTERLRADMAESQQRIERTRAESRLLLDETHAILNKLAA